MALSGKSLGLGTFIPPPLVFPKGRCREILPKNSVGGSNKKPHTEFVTLEAYGKRDYMVPKKFVFLEQMPMTNNGKADRKKLAELGKKPERKVMV